jgi:hypothetical protein
VAELQKNDGGTNHSWNAVGGARARSFTMLQLYIFFDTNVMWFRYFRGSSSDEFSFSLLGGPFFAPMKQKREFFLDEA